MKQEAEVFINSCQSLMWSPMSAKSGRSNIKPIFKLLPHVAENFVVKFDIKRTVHRDIFS